MPADRPAGVDVTGGRLAGEAVPPSPLLEVRDLVKHFPLPHTLLDVALRRSEIGAIVAKYQGTTGPTCPNFVKVSSQRRRRRRLPRAEVPAVRHRQRGRAAARSPCRTWTPAKEAKRHELRTVRRGSSSPPRRRAKSAKMHREAYEAARRLQKGREAFKIDAEWDEAPRAVRRQRVRPALPAGPQAGRVGRGVRRGRPEQLRLARRQLRVAQGAGAADGARLGRPARRPDSSAACSRRRSSSGRARSAARRASTTAPAATTTSAAGPRPWPAAASRAGLVYGASDEDGVEVKDNPVTEGDFFATIYQALGIDPDQRTTPACGRSRWPRSGSQVVKDLLA